jgi:hypothetical protein
VVVPLGAEVGGCGLVASGGLVLKYNCSCKHNISSVISSCYRKLNINNACHITKKNKAEKT